MSAVRFGWRKRSRTWPSAAVPAVALFTVPTKQEQRTIHVLGKQEHEKTRPSHPRFVSQSANTASVRQAPTPLIEGQRLDRRTETAKSETTCKVPPTAGAFLAPEIFSFPAIGGPLDKSAVDAA